MRVLIIEDELSISEQLTKLFSKALTNVDICHAYNLADAELMVQTHVYDLISVDIQLPDGNGLDFARKYIELFKSHQTEFIVLTGYFNFESAYIAINDLNCLKYLPKPIDSDQFNQLINDYIENHETSVKPHYFIFKNKFIYLRIAYDDILYFERSLTDCLLYTTKGNYKLGRLSISSLQSELDSTVFIQIHRSLIINWNNVNCLRKSQGHWQVELNYDDFVLPVGKTFYSKLPLDI